MGVPKPKLYAVFKHPVVAQASYWFEIRRYDSTSKAVAAVMHPQCIALWNSRDKAKLHQKYLVEATHS